QDRAGSPPPPRRSLLPRSGSGSRPRPAAGPASSRAKWARSQAPAQAATAARGRRLVTQQRGAEMPIALAVPDLAQALLGPVAQGETVIAAHRERGDAARQGAAMRGDVHQAPRPPA